jgi:hypothetical protein
MSTSERGHVTFVPTCAKCGVPVDPLDTTCFECQMRTLERMMMLREYLIRTIDDPECVLPYTDRKLS